MIFRLISAPTLNIPIIAELPTTTSIPRSQLANDFGDYWLIKLEPDIAPSFRRTLEEFRSDARRGSPFLISGFNNVAYILELNEDPTRWADAFRWTQVWGAQWFAVNELPEPRPTALAERSCIYHRAPTFGGLSGSPIIGSDFDSTGRPLRRFVVGLHLRSGVPDDTYQLNADCGSFPDFNIGLALHPEILQHVTRQ
jgi:hypothetical protein